MPASHNATDSDTGFQGFVDSEGWRWLDVRGPGGQVLRFEARGTLAKLGLTELFFESVGRGDGRTRETDEFATLVPSNTRNPRAEERAMRVVVNEFMSLDGVVQAPGGAEEDTDGGFAHGGWSMPYFDPEVMGPVIFEGMSTVEALLFGRRTWQGMASAWPGRAGDPYADQMNAIRKYVVSRTLTPDDLSWSNTTLLPGDRAVADIAALRAQEGGDLLIWGSVSLVKTLLAEGLVDELNLMIEPILLGGGKRIFPEDGTARPLQLVKCVTAGTGVQVCTYRFAS